MSGALAFVVGSAISRPTLSFPPSVPAAGHAQAFQKALVNLLDINTLPYDLARYDRSGLLKGQPGKFIRAGGDYHEPWTRDAAINSWNAASLLEPEIARNTLYAVLDKDAQGHPIVQPDNQWWDSVVWIIGAWNHYSVTGDAEFLKTSYGAAQRLLARMRAERYDAEFGLFQGPSFFNDGIAGYPAPPAPADDSGSTFVLDHPDTDKIMALSTNCLYVEAYRAAARMSQELGESNEISKQYIALADALKRSIDKQFWLPERGLYGYFIHGAAPKRGELDPTEEGCGLSFAVLFGIAPRDRARSILKQTHVEPLGITDTYPCYPRYAPDRPGRHNVLVWPVVQGLWARATVKLRNVTLFEREMSNLAKLALGTDGNFYEIYDPRTGQIEGGWQSGNHHGSVPNQTWSATAYLSMVLNGVFGMRFEPTGLRFQPLVPKGWDGATLAGLRYRRATLDIRVDGHGSRVKSATMDGRALVAPSLSGELEGHHKIVLTMSS